MVYAPFPSSIRIYILGFKIKLARIPTMDFKFFLATRMFKLGFKLYMARICDMGYNRFWATRIHKLGFKLNTAYLYMWIESSI